jgi:hypothetical protein
MSQSPPRASSRPSRSRARILLGRAFAAATFAAALAAIAPEARADEKSSCVASYDRSQVLRRDHRFQRAREELKMCSRVACPALVRNDCITWLDQVQAAFPSITIRAMKDGGDVASVKVIEDNEIVATRLDGTSLEVEPGEHSFRFETEGAPPVTLTLVVHEREKDRVVPVTFTSPHTQEDAAVVTRPVPTGVYVAGALGLVGLASFGVLGGVGKNEQSSLQGTCSPNCSQSAIDKVRTDYIAADVGLGIGAAALVTAGVWYLVRPKHTEGAPAPATTVGVAPSRGGALIGWSGTF